MFRFTIRDVLWLMVVVGLGLGWWVDHSRLVAMWNSQRGRILFLTLELDGRENGWNQVKRRHNIPMAPLPDDSNDVSNR